MLTKSIVLIFMCLYFNVLGVDKESCVRVWIDIEGEVQNLSLKANLMNNGNQVLSLNYVLNVTKKGRSGETNSLQKGAFVVANNKIIFLSEARMHLRKGDELIAKLLIYHDEVIVAQDSVVYHGDNY